MTRSVLRVGWFVGSLMLVACGGRTLGLPDDEGDLGPSTGRGGTGGTGGSVSTGGSGPVSSGGGAGTPSAGGSLSVGGTGSGAASTKGGAGGISGNGGTGGTQAKGGTGGSGGSGGSGGKGGGSTGKGGKGGNNGKGGNTGKGGNAGFSSCDDCQEAVYEKCEPAYQTCLDDTNCGGLIECFQDCGPSDKCTDGCFNKWEKGVDQYYQLAACFVCGTCEEICDSPKDFCDQFLDGEETPPSPGMPQPG